MFGDILNGIPVVGHVLGLLHYASGNTLEGDKAMMAATRTSAVMTGGVAGIVGGPAGVIAGATGAGLLVDTLTSIASRRPVGILEGISDIAIDIENGDIPVSSVIKTGFYVGADALSGFSGGALLSNVGGTVSKSMAKDAAKIIAKNVTGCQLAVAGSLTRKFAENSPRSYPRPKNNGTKQQSSQSSSKTQASKPKSNLSQSYNTGSSGSGSQPPREPNKKKDHEKEKGETHLDAFLKLFNVSSLEDVVICGVRVFKNLEPGQVKSLKKLIKQLRLNGVLKRVIETVINLSKKMQISDISFQNFLSLSQFVAAYILEQAAQKTEAQKGQGLAQNSYEQRRQENLDAASRDALAPIGRPNLLTIFMDLNLEISSYCCQPNFRNIFSAIYHYFKHKMVPQTNQQLTVSNYFSIIKYLLEKVKTHKEYAQLIDRNHSRRELVYDRVYMVFGRLVRVRIVLKIQDGDLELSSCYVLNDDTEYDQNSEEFIDPDKKRG